MSAKALRFPQQSSHTPSSCAIVTGSVCPMQHSSTVCRLLVPVVLLPETSSTEIKRCDQGCVSARYQAGDDDGPAVARSPAVIPEAALRMLVSCAWRAQC